MPKLANIVPSLFIILVSACASVPLTSMYKLSQLSPLEADPRQIRVAIRTTDAIRLSMGDVRMLLGYQADDGSLIIADEYLIEIEHNQTSHPELLDDLQPGEAITLLSLSDTDALQMAESQRLIREQKAKDIQGQGSFSISIHSSCLQKPLPEGKVLVDIFLKTAQQQTFFVFNKNLDLTQTDFPNDGNLEGWPTCEHKQN